MKPIVEIRNTVATTDIGTKLDLQAIDDAVDEASYDPGTFPGLVLRTTKPRAGALLFSSGKMVCLGTKSEDDVNRAVATVVEKLRSVGVKIPKTPKARVVNMVGTIELGRTIRVTDAALSLPRSMYEPDMFPGLVHRMVDPRVVLLVFASGKIVCAGAKTEDDVRRASGQLASALEDRKLFGRAAHA